MYVAQNSHFCLTNNSNMRKWKTAIAINCNKLYNIACIVRGHVENTIHYLTELNCTVLLQSLWHLAADSICFKVVCEAWKVFMSCLYKVSFWWRLRCAASRINASPLERGSFSCLIWPLFRWLSYFWWQNYALISITRAITCGNLIKFAFQDGWQAFF